MHISASGGLVSLLLSLWPDTSPGSVLVTIEGLSPSTKYYLKHDNDLTLAEETTDAAGTLAFTRSRDAYHFTVLSPVHGSLALSAATCVPPIGSWTAGTSTCVLLQDVPDADVSILEDSLTIDCRDPNTGVNHRIGSSSVRQALGVSWFERSSVTLRNCEIVNVDRVWLPS